MAVILTLQEVDDLSRDALVGCGVDTGNAASVARSIREAEAEGIRNVGLAYLPHYCEHALCGKVDGQVRPELRQTAPAALLVDAKQGFAHPAFDIGEEPLLSLAKSQGLAALGVGNSYASGVIGYFASRIAEAGLIGLAFTNASASIAPWGGTKPLFGTNPIAIGIPRSDAPPIVVDQSSSTTARVNVVQAAQRGETIPETWALDAQGRPTNDPNEGLKGSIAPLGGHKGAGLALLVEVLAAGLVGANWSFQASPLGNNEGGPPNIGQLYIAIDPALFGVSDFAIRLEALVSAMLAQDGTRLPGDGRHRARRNAEVEGIVLEDALYSSLTAYVEGRSSH